MARILSCRVMPESCPIALHVLRRQNYLVDDLRSKSWDEFAQPDSPELDFVFTLCNRAWAENCPVWPGQPMTAHWGMVDPAAFGGTERIVAFNDTMKMLTNRISIFASLPIHSLDRLSLQKQLEAIGKTAMPEAQPEAQTA